MNPGTTQRFILYVFSFWRDNPFVGLGLHPHSRGFFFSRLHTSTHHSRQDYSGRVISSSQRPVPDNTKHSQQTVIHAPGEILTHDLSSRPAPQTARPLGPAHSTCICIKLYFTVLFNINHLTPNGHYMGHTAQLTSRCCILYIYSTNIRTEYFKHAA